MTKSIIYLFLMPILFFGACQNDDNVEPTAVSYAINTETSKVGWTGYLPNGNNFGTFSMDPDEIQTQEGQIIGGSFTIPVATVEVLNLVGDDKELLEHHLMSSDFFDAILHPNVTFEIKEVKPYNDFAEGVVEGANYTVTGALTLLGTTKDLSFPAKIELNKDQLKAEALIKINRLDWGMNYASDATAEQYILPDVDVHLILSATRK